MPRGSLRAYRSLPSGADVVQPGEEVVDGARTLDVIVQLLAQQALSQVDGVLPHLLAKVSNDGSAVGLQLLVTSLNDAVGLLGCLRLHVSDDLLPLGASIITDLSRFGACLCELLVVLLEGFLSLGLSGLGTLNATLDCVLTLSQHILELRKDNLREDKQDDGKRDNGPDDVIKRWNERVNRLFQRQRLSCQEKGVRHSLQLSL